MSFNATHQKLYAEVVAQPHDDEPRLAFARHIEASHPYRARFIDLQIARIRADVVARRWRSEPSPEELKLVRQHGAEWLQMIAPLTRPLQGAAPGEEFNRGFIERVCTTPEIVTQMWGRLFALAPILHLEVRRPDPVGSVTIRELLEVPALRGLDSLHLTNWDLSDGDVKELAQCENLANLSTLDLRANRIGRAGIEALAQSPITRGILSIDLALNQVEPPQVPGYDDEGNMVTRVTSLGRDLEARHGPIPWVHVENLQGADLYHRRHVAQAYRAAH